MGCGGGRDVKKVHPMKNRRGEEIKERGEFLGRRRRGEKRFLKEEKKRGGAGYQTSPLKPSMFGGVDCSSYQPTYGLWFAFSIVERLIDHCSWRSSLFNGVRFPVYDNTAQTHSHGLIMNDLMR